MQIFLTAYIFWVAIAIFFILPNKGAMKWVEYSILPFALIVGIIVWIFERFISLFIEK